MLLSESTSVQCLARSPIRQTSSPQGLRAAFVHLPPDYTITARDLQWHPGRNLPALRTVSPDPVRTMAQFASPGQVSTYGANDCGGILSGKCRAHNGRLC